MIGTQSLPNYIKSNASLFGFAKAEDTLTESEVNALISAALSGYATESWVTSQGYYKSGSISKYGSATCSTVDGHSHSIAIYG